MSTDFAEPLQQLDRVYVRTKGRKLLYFGGCDYYRLSSHPKIIVALHAGLDEYGISTAASRKTTGNHPLYQRLEFAAAKFFKAPCAVVMSSGFLANVAVAQALRGTIDLAFVDERSHGSIKDALCETGASVVLFRHRDPADLKQKSAGAARSRRTLVVTDGIFAFDGSIAPVAEYRRAAGPHALLWVDDAHAAGVLGSGGRGTFEHAGISGRNAIQTVTFSKAFGVYGGAILCDATLRRSLIQKSSALAGNTPLPLPLAFGCLTALRSVRGSLRQRLQQRIKTFWQAFDQRTPRWPTPIVGLRAQNPARLRQKLSRVGIYPSFIQYGGGPSLGYFRFALSSEHTLEQITLLANTLRDGGAQPL